MLLLNWMKLMKPELTDEQKQSVLMELIDKDFAARQTMMSDEDVQDCLQFMGIKKDE